MLPRFIEKQIIKALKPKEVVCLFGPRRTGKTVLMKMIKQKLEKKNSRILLVQGDNLEAAEILSSQRLTTLQNFIKGYTHLFVDEAQIIPNIGTNLKLLTDNVDDVSIFVTGSSAFDLKSQVGEPLVGRSKIFYLYPFAQMELQKNEDYLKTITSLENRLIFGSYPQVTLADTKEEKKEKLESIRDGYLLKDILSLDNLKDSLFIFNLLRLLAFQIGKNVSYSELASNLEVQGKTVRRYLELLEKSYIVYSLHGFSRNLRKEITKNPRFYFFDNGIRNVLISNFNNFSMRDDIGALWENYVMTERMKKCAYKKISANKFFWRTYDKKEIDLVEERDGKLYGYEIKWKNKTVKPPKDFMENYPNAEFKMINQDNYIGFIA